MNKSPKYIRALNQAIQIYLDKNPIQRDEPKKSPSNLLRSHGYIHKDIEDEINKLSEGLLSKQNSGDLENIEKCSFDNWFRIHPEKVAGEVKITTSREFPLTIIGNKAQIIDCLENGLKEKNTKIPQLLLKEMELIENSLFGFQKKHKKLIFR